MVYASRIATPDLTLPPPRQIDGVRAGAVGLGRESIVGVSCTRSGRSESSRMKVGHPLWHPAGNDKDRCQDVFPGQRP